MAKLRVDSRVELVGDGGADSRAADGERAFVVAVLGDFRGQQSATLPEPALPHRRLVSIDRDSFDSVLARFQPHWRGTLGGGDSALAVELTFAALDDFHPDRIVPRIPALAALLDRRCALEDPRRFAATAAAWASAPRATPAAVPVQVRGDRDVSPAGLLDRVLEETAPTGDAVVRSVTRTDLDAFVERIVAPHLVRLDARRQAELIAAVDQALSEQLRGLLHDPAFQHIEAAWRSLWRLVAAVEDECAFKIRLVHYPQDDLRRDLPPPPECADAVRSMASTLLAGETPPHLVIGNYAFDDSTEDLAFVERLAAVAARWGAPLVAAASPQLLGCKAFTALPDAGGLLRHVEDPEREAWRAWRQAPAAAWIALALPRFLCRLPYGPATEPVETFAFDEARPPDVHEHLLWANPAFAVGEAVARAFAEEGWALDLARQVHHLEGLPAYTYRDGDRTVMKPCGEALLPDSVVGALEAAGFTPLVSARDRDILALPCIQALHEPRMPLPIGRVRSR
jgi:type VI secretion system protein ImpC